VPGQQCVYFYAYCQHLLQHSHLSFRPLSLIAQLSSADVWLLPKLFRHVSTEKKITAGGSRLQQHGPSGVIKVKSADHTFFC
jgi:hypothetical protein